eukprot:6190271-Pleurochrysis_carterae.AAC.2
MYARARTLTRSRTLGGDYQLFRSTTLSHIEDQKLIFSHPERLLSLRLSLFAAALPFSFRSM